MVRKKPTLFMLKRGELRQSWNKYNLYNFSRFDARKVFRSDSASLFKKKWKSKAKTRKYHGEQVLEKHWQRLFSPTMRTVVPMDPAYMAQSDGLIESAGRGSGADAVDVLDRSKRTHPTPYMNMTFAPLERRLDVAIHRALFASSIRQARQFCVHGFVRVNGKPMIYPSYALNPGDMFSVDPDRVMFATGAPKGTTERRETRRLRKADQPAAEDAEAEAEGEKSEPVVQSEGPLQEEEAKDILKKIMAKTKDVLSEEKDTASASRKRDLRELSKLVRSTISKSKGMSPTDAVSDQMSALMEKLGIEEVAEPENSDGKEQTAVAVAEDSPTRSLTPKQKRDLEQLLQELRENPIDPSKPYATPWRPRDFMSAFAFIPRYLEVHHKVCSAVYLRHPVARPGLAEVPTPFNLEMNGLAFNWYLRRR